MPRELVTITDAAKRLGLSRPRLSGYLKAAKLEKVTRDGRELVAFEDVQAVVQERAARGQLRVPSVTRNTVVDRNDEAITRQFTDLLKDELTRCRDENMALRRRNDDLVDKLTATAAEVSALSQKLLEAPSVRQGATSGVSPDVDSLAQLVDQVRGLRGGEATPRRQRGLLARLLTGP